MNVRTNLCRALAAVITADTQTMTGASQAVMDQTCRAMGLDGTDNALAEFMQRHTQVMLSMLGEIEDLYAVKLEESDLTVEDLELLIEIQKSPVPKKFAQVMVTLLGSREMERLIQKVNEKLFDEVLACV